MGDALSRIIKTQDARIEAGEDIGKFAVNLHCYSLVDEDGNDLPPRHQPHVGITLDNYQAYELAMYLLSKLDVWDNRGST